MYNRNRLSSLAGGFLFAVILINPLRGNAGEPINQTPAPSGQLSAPSDGRTENSKIRVEIALSPERKKDIDAIKKEFEVFSITNVRPQFFRQGNPPQNIGFGREIPVEVAREAIRVAMTYNRGIQFLLPEKRLAPHYIGIGVSIFDEAFQVPVGPEELKRLSDPSLTNAQFHDLYHQMTDQPPRINR